MEHGPCHYRTLSIVQSPTPSQPNSNANGIANRVPVVGRWKSPPGAVAAMDDDAAKPPGFFFSFFLFSVYFFHKALHFTFSVLFCRSFHLFAAVGALLHVEADVLQVLLRELEEKVRVEERERLVRCAVRCALRVRFPVLLLSLGLDLQARF